MPGNGQRWFALARTAVIATLFIGMFLIWLPWHMGAVTDNWDFNGARAWRLLGLLPAAVGLLVALSCAFEFAWTGRGTPAPFDPPRVLVVKGLYRYVRNPMYVGAAIALAGAWIAVGRANLAALLFLLGIAVGVNIFIFVFEEPVLHKMFGAEYEEYCRNVGRWWPRLSPWEGSDNHEDPNTRRIA